MNRSSFHRDNGGSKGLEDWVVGTACRKTMDLVFGGGELQIVQAGQL